MHVIDDCAYRSHVLENVRMKMALILYPRYNLQLYIIDLGLKGDQRRQAYNERFNPIGDEHVIDDCAYKSHIKGNNAWKSYLYGTVQDTILKH